MCEPSCKAGSEMNVYALRHTTDNTTTLHDCSGRKLIVVTVDHVSFEIPYKCSRDILTIQKRICKSFANAFNNNCLFHLLVFRFLMCCSLITYQKKKINRVPFCMNKPVQNKKAHPIKSDEPCYF